MARFHLDRLDFRLLLAHVLMYPRKKSFYPTITKPKTNRGAFRISTKITVTFEVLVLSSHFYKLYAFKTVFILRGSENTFLKLPYEKCNAFAALGLGNMSTIDQKWLKKGAWAHLF